METIKLEQNHLDEIQAIREKYADYNAKIGTIATDEYFVSLQLNEIKTAKEEIFADFKILKEKEQKFIEELREKYGDGQINIQEGTFTAVPVTV